jgi:hypothetical protein
MQMWGVAQFFDDVADGDPVDRADLDRVLWSCLAGIPTNTFYQTHAATLLPLIATTIFKWQASDAAERAGRRDATTFIWRAGLYDVVVMVVYICHGTAAAQSPVMLDLYGESFADYMGADHA